jgi:hypothetical protein
MYVCPATVRRQDAHALNLTYSRTIEIINVVRCRGIFSPLLVDIYLEAFSRRKRTEGWTLGGIAMSRSRVSAFTHIFNIGMPSVGYVFAFILKAFSLKNTYFDFFLAIVCFLFL